MKPRLNVMTAAPAALNAMLALQSYVDECGLEHSLGELVKTRASQINGCSFCLHMHTADARKAGESEERLHLVAAWRESPLFTPRERAALAWTEALTRLADAIGVSDEVYEEVRQHFSEEELMNLSLLIGVINTWNRINVGFRTVHPVKQRTGAAAGA